MYTKDRIIKGSEITNVGRFTLDVNPFYIFIAPISVDANTILIADCQLSYDQKEDEPFPFACGCWNPVVLNSITITAQMLLDYRVFWGVEK